MNTPATKKQIKTNLRGFFFLGGVVKVATGAVADDSNLCASFL